MSNRSPAGSTSTEEQPEQQSTASNDQSTILFVDDDSNVTAGARRALRRYPYTVVCADSADAALRILGSQDVDVIVSDEQMPGMTGTALLSQARRRYPSVTRILLTGKASLDAAINAINEGEIFRLVTKPCKPAELAAVLTQAIRHRRLMIAARSLLQKSKEQSALLHRLEDSNPGITQLTTDEEGAIVMDDVEASLEELLDALEH